MPIDSFRYSGLSVNDLETDSKFRPNPLIIVSDEFDKFRIISTEETLSRNTEK